MSMLKNKYQTSGRANVYGGQARDHTILVRFGDHGAREAFINENISILREAQLRKLNYSHDLIIRGISEDIEQQLRQSATGEHALFMHDHKVSPFSPA